MAFNPALLPANLTGSIASNTRFWPTINAKAPLFGADFVNNRYMKSGSEVTIGNLFTTQTRASTKQIPDTTGLLTSIATNTMPRTDRGAWIEESRINLQTYSQDYTNIVWTKHAAADVTAAATTAPDGTSTGTKLIDKDTTSSVRNVTTATSITSGTTYTISVIAKAGEYSWLEIASGNAVKGYRFNLTTGATAACSVPGFTDASTPYIFNLANGWKRCSITITAASTASADIRIFMDNGTRTYTGVVGQGLYLWGTQVEASAFPSSYIATTFASVTRAADTFNIYPIPTMTGKGTMFVEFEAPYLGTSNFSGIGTLCLNGAESNNRINLYVADGGLDEVTGSYNAGGVNYAALTLGSAPTPNTVYRAVITFDTNDVKAIRNGVSVQSDTSATMFTPDKFMLGSLIVGGNWANCFIRRFYVFSDTFTNAELATMVA